MRRPRLFASLAALSVVLAACSGGSGQVSAPVVEETTAPEDVQELSTCEQVAIGRIVQMPDGEFAVCEFETSYRTAAQGGGADWADEAAFAMSGYGLGKTAGGSALNHPSSGASDGTRLVIADRFNNRVVVFNSLPTGPQVPDLVLGQPDFVDTTPGTTLEDMNWPGAVEITPTGMLLVADTENGRILVFSTIPTTSGAAADFALDLEALTGEADAWPWGIWSDGESLVVTDTRKGNILVWKTFPRSSEEKPSSVTNPSGVGTPRNITSDGTNFLIGDENGSQATCWGVEPQNRMRQSHVWINRLPIGDPDGCVWDWYQGDSYQGGVIALAAGGRDAHFWPAFPVDDATARAKTSTGGAMAVTPPAADQSAGFAQPAEPGQGDPNSPPVEPGQPVPAGQPVEPGGQLPPMTSTAEQPLPAGGGTAPSPQQTQIGHSYLGGDGGDVVVTQSAIYFVEYNGNRVTAWNTMPENLVGKSPDFSVFDPDADVSTLLRDGFIQNPVLAKAGPSLVATSDYDRRMYVWSTHPGEDSARANYVYLTGFPAWDNSYADGTLVIAGQKSVAWWKTFVPGQMPDVVVSGALGSVAFDDIRGVAYDGTYLAIADREAVVVFEGLPVDGQDPLRVYAIRGPGRLDMRDGLLSIAPREGADIYLVDVAGSSAPQRLEVRVNLPMQTRFLDSGYAIADTSFHRIQLWSNVEAALRGEPPARILGGAIGERPQTSRDRFYFPSSIEEVGGVLYVGEFKFSNRILAFVR